ncbi:MAG: DUF5362 family protein [bacterium]
MNESTMDQSALVKEISSPLFESRGWMKLIGVLAIVQGGLIALSIVGIIIAWLPIWMGVILYQSSSTIEQAMHTGDKQSVILSLQKIKLYFTITGVITLIGIAIVALAFAMGLFGILMEGMRF